MSEWAAKRFYKKVTTRKSDGGFEIALDDRPLRTPGKTPLIVPTQLMASAIAQEWEAQEGLIDPNTMPVTRSANSAIEKVTARRNEIEALLAEYGRTDLLCYRAAEPQGLRDQQAQAWDPLLVWAAKTFGAQLRTTSGIMPVDQDELAITKLKKPMTDLTSFQFAAFHDLVTIPGSLVLGWAIARGHVSAAQAWQICQIDEDWQSTQWGRDEEATLRAAKKKNDLVIAADILALATV